MCDIRQNRSDNMSASDVIDYDNNIIHRDICAATTGSGWITLGSTTSTVGTQGAGLLSTEGG